MKRFWRNPLVYKEWKSVRWITLLMTLGIFFTKIMNVMSHLKWIKEIEADGKYCDIPIATKDFPLHIKYWFNQALLGHDNEMFSVFMIGCLVILVVVLFRSERQNKTYGLLASMPFKRKDIIVTKWYMGMLSIFISCFIGFIALSVFYISNIKYIQDSYSIVLKWSLLHMLMYMSIFTILFFVQTLMGQNITGSIVGVIIIFVPFFILSIISSLIQVYAGLSWKDKIIINIDRIARKLNLYDFNRTEWIEVSKDKVSKEFTYYGDHYFIYNNYNFKIIALLIILCIFFALSIYAYKRNAFEKNGNLILFSALEPVFKYGVAICSGLWLSAIFGLGYADNNKIVIGIFLVIGSVVGYFISNKAIKICASSNK
ncbi:ABC transporter permease [Clostridium ganghwense]|uniref:ABC-2 transporter permease n=1 Tax=Clostridium ganghwense TaxID=312089 RepID=A0ABT4CM52_9CLOT|nr:ABC-2 transporter permease [Clostridium ganghwense]MCY6370132.1 ABC-2 transporter permease [Clostridium ganghwense]